MKKIFFLIVLLYVSFSYSQNKPIIHYIAFADNVKYKVQTDISEYCAQDLVIMKELLTTTSELCGFDFKEYNKPNNFSSNALKDVLFDLDKSYVGKEDVIVFFYSGHGGRSIDTDVNKNPYPALLFNLEQDEQYQFSLLKIHNLLKTAGQRLLITIGDLCNSLDSELLPENDVLELANESNYKSKFSKLFLEAQGDIIVTSSKPNQTSGVVTGNNGAALGSIFTTSFQYVIANYLENAPIEHLTWENIFEQTKITCDENSKALTNKNQNPVSNYNLTYKNK